MATRRRQAAEWLIRLEDPELSAGELLQWEAWMQSSARNRRTFREMEQVARRFEENRADLMDIPIPSHRERESDAAIGTGMRDSGIGSRLRRFLSGILDQLAPWPARSARAAIVAGIVVVLAGLALLMRVGILGPAATDSMQSYRTELSQHQRIGLPDGSAIAMGAKSSLSVNFSPHRRVVILESGEALFEVAQDDRRPFIVMAGAGTITALGTVFNVRRDGDRVVVTVTEGSVELKRTAQGASVGSRVRDSSRQQVATTLGAGGQAVISATELSVVELRNPDSVTEWQTGHLQYRAEPLRYVVAGVSRYSAKEIIIVGRDVENMLFTGSVYPDQTDDWLEALESVFPVEVVRAGENKVLIQMRRSPD